MPGMAFPDPTPSWLKKENASVLDPWWKTAIRALNPITGADDPTGQVMGVGMTNIPGPKGVSMAARRAIEDARQLLQKTGPLPPDQLRAILTQVPAKHAHHVTKGMPGLPPPEKALKRILTPSTAREGYAATPSVSERVRGLVGIGEALPQHGTWGGSREAEMLNAFAGNKKASDLAGKIFAALSTRTSVPKNSKELISVWLDHLRNPGRVFTDERMRRLGVGNAGSKTDNVMRAILGDDPSGPKVELFTDFMGGGTPLPVPDVHYLRGVGSRHPSIDDMLPELRKLVEKVEKIPARSGELHARDYVRRLNQPVAEELMQHSSDPAKGMGSLFGNFWDGSRAYQGLKFQGGPVDILRPRGLMERGAMLDERALVEALRDPRSWTALALAGLAARSSVGGEGRQGTAGGPPPPPPMPFALGHSPQEN